MTDLLLDLLDKAIEKELKSSIRYTWQYLMVQNLDIKEDFRVNALEKLKQVMKLGRHLLDLGEIPASAPENIGRSLKEMIDLDLKAENAVIKIYQEIIEASKEEDAATLKMFEKILMEEKERKKVLMCALGRATRRTI